MKTFQHLVLATALLAALAACGGSRPSRSGAAVVDGGSPAPGTSTVTPTSTTAPTPPPGEGAPAPAPAPTPAADSGAGGDLASGLAAIRVLGVANTSFSSVLVAVKSLDVTVDGAPVTVDFSRVQATFELANGAQAWLAGRIAMPPAGSIVHVKLVLDEAAAFVTGDAAGDLRTCGPAIEFDAPAEWFALRGHAVVHLHLDRSIIGAGTTRDLVPQLQIEF